MQPCHPPFLIWNPSVVPCPVLTVASCPAYRFLRRLVGWSGMSISWRIFQFVLIYKVKGFGVINKAVADDPLVRHFLGTWHYLGRLIWCLEIFLANYSNSPLGLMPLIIKTQPISGRSEHTLMENQGEKKKKHKVLFNLLWQV